MHSASNRAKFKAGDRVRCIEPIYGLDAGSIYTVKEAKFSKYLGNVVVLEEVNDPSIEGFYEYRFEFVQQSFKKGDVVVCKDSGSNSLIISSNRYIVEEYAPELMKIQGGCVRLSGIVGWYAADRFAFADGGLATSAYTAANAVENIPEKSSKNIKLEYIRVGDANKLTLEGDISMEDVLKIMEIVK